MRTFFLRTTILFLLVLLALNLAIAQDQQRQISGTVKDERGNTLPGVSVKGGERTVSTNENGKFQISVAETIDTLHFSYIGMQELDLAINQQSTLEVVLRDAATMLDDVVVVGYGTVKKRDLTGAVSTVKSEDLTQVATNDPIQALQGRAAGVEITSNSGEPGAGTRIRVRGIGTLNNSNPLYVVDGFQTGDISFLAPGDIESMEILKDASATAIYGSRGANGVVMVTTKKGKVGKPTVNLDVWTGLQQVWKKLDLTDAAGYATLVTEAYRNDGLAVPSTFQERLQNAITNQDVGTNWQDQITQNGVIQNYSLNFSGGTEQNRYVVSGNFFDQQGTIRNSGLQRYNFRFKNDFKMNKWLDGGVTASFNRSRNTIYDANVMRNALSVDPIATPYAPDGNYSFADLSGGGSNPERLIMEQDNNRNTNQNFLGNAYLTAKLFKGLSFRSDFGVNYANSLARNFLPKYYVGITEQRNLSQLTESRGENINWVWTNYLTYQSDWQDHSLNATLGQESQRTKFSSNMVTAYDVPNDASLQYISSSRNVEPLVSSDQQDESLLSYFARANYSYKNKYLATATVRFDQSSRFLSSERLGVFPSFSLAWRISEEDFLKQIDAINSLKLRGSYGQVGNQNSALNYGYATTVNPNMYYVFNGVIQQGVIPTQLSNPLLRWESTATTNFGLDAELLSSKLSITADYFIKNTDDMILIQPVPDYVGAAPPRANVGSIQNKGFELAVSYGNNIGELRYDVGANFTKVINKVTSLGGGSPLESGNIISQMGNTTRTEVDKEVAYYYGLKTQGIFQSQADIDNYINTNGALIQPNAKPGDVKFIDVNNDGQISSADRAYLGSATNPDFSYGFNVNLAYKNIDFKLFFQGVQGFELVNGLSRYLAKTSNSTGSWPNFYANRLNRWTPENPNTDQPRLTTRDLNNNDQFSDRYVEDGSYLRLRNIQIGYRLANGVAEKLRISSFRVYLAVDNLLTFTKYTGLDPEISEAGFYQDPLAYGVDFGNYPQPRTFRLGLNVQF